MAHGFLCTKCGCQESEHELGMSGVCKTYISPSIKAEKAAWLDDYKQTGDPEALHRSKYPRGTLGNRNQ